MRNCTQESLDVITLGVQDADSGKAYNVNGVLGVAEGDASTTSPYPVPLKTEGIFTFTKQTGFTAAIGDVAFYDLGSDKRLEAFALAGNVPIGFYAAAALTGDTTASVIFDPTAAEAALEVHKIRLPFTANDVTSTTFMARRAGKVVGISYYTTGKPSSAAGTILLTSKNVGVSDNALFSSTDLEGITDNALTAITLTATAADLVFAQGGIAEFIVTSNHSDGLENDGVDLYLYFQRT